MTKILNNRTFRVALAAGCFLAAMGTPGFGQDWDGPLGVASSEARLSDFRGLAMPSKSVTLSAPVDGVLASILVDEGESVLAGDLVAQMDDAVQAAVVETARVRMESDAAIKRSAAELKAASAELERTRQMRERGAGSALELLRAEARFEAAEADLDQANENHAIDTWTLRLEQARLDEFALRAPFSGVVTRKEASEGTSLAQSAPVVTLVQLDPLEAEVHLPVSMGMPEAGRRYVLRAGLPVGREVVAELTFVSPVIDPASRTFRCKFTIVNEGLRLPAGFDVSLVSLEPLAEAAEEPTVISEVETADGVAD